MTAAVVNLHANGGSESVKKKRVLLVDTCRAQRDMRGETMRRMGMEVDCAADISEARCWWRPELYDLVLFHVETELPHMYKFWDDIRATTPSQQVAFLVGKPEYLAASPNGDASASEQVSTAAVLPDSGPSLSRRETPGVPGYWGIMEACRRISTVRSIADARSRALRERPLPRRDSADDEVKRLAAKFRIDAELNREDKQ
ncbi:MAG TPA: response regulator [Terriglobales bacterium]|nr:response regulator [Terriglobales bacterium]